MVPDTFHSTIQQSERSNGVPHFPNEKDSKRVWFPRTKTVIVGSVGCFLIAGTVIAGVFTSLHLRSSASNGSPDAGTSEVSAEDAQAIQVKTVKPRFDQKDFVRSVTQPAYVKGFFQADLMAHVAGPVKFIQKNIGDPITQGEVLIELDVPDLVQDVVQKEALVRQAEQDARAAEATVTIMQAAEKQARSLIQGKEADVARAVATRKFRAAELQRFQNLVSQNAAVASIVDERQRDYEAADADCKTVQVAVETARAAAEEVSAKLSAARVDVDVKRARVAVARADLARAQVMLDYAKIRAPFNGTIAARRVDPGAFVQNASTGNPTPVLSVVRTDKVTVVMWVPEKDAPYVTKVTEAIIRLDALGGQEIRGKVTRLSHWLDPDKSRDMRVEVDLENSPDLVKAIEARGPRLPAGKDLRPVIGVTLTAATTPAPASGPLKPGMYGTMTLVLQKFDHAPLIPAGAVIERGGRTCIFEVVGDRARLVPVRVQLEDGVRAKVVKLVQQLNPKTGVGEEVPQELTAQEEIVRSGQGELADGQLVKATPAQW